MMDDFVKMGKTRKIMEQEPNFYETEIDGYKCVIIRIMGHLNGYVGVKKDSKLYGMNYYGCDDEVNELQKKINDIVVHGGLTFADKFKTYKDLEEYWFFGFDTAHSWDYYIGCYDFDGKGIYRDFNYVLDEVKRLVEQIKEIENS